MPERPPMVNIVTRPMAHRMGAVKVSFPPHIVAIQLRIFTPVGTALNIVEMEKAATAMETRPEANIWWAHPPKPLKLMEIQDQPTTQTNVSLGHSGSVRV